MNLPKNTIRNPLTIIGIFAALSEISGTTVLAFLPENIQLIFIWFVIFFPILLVALFFWVLITRHHVLYAPSDFKSDESFSGLINSARTQTHSETKMKKLEDLEDVEIEEKDVIEKTPINNIISNPKIEYFVAEELAISKLKEKWGKYFQPHQTFELKGNFFSVDGLVDDKKQLEIYEIKFFPRLKTPLSGIGKTYNYFREILMYIDSSDKRYIIFNLIIVTSINKNEQTELQSRIKEFLDSREVKINFEIYDLNELKREYGIE